MAAPANPHCPVMQTKRRQKAAILGFCLRVYMSTLLAGDLRTPCLSNRPACGLGGSVVAGNKRTGSRSSEAVANVGVRCAQTKAGSPAQ